MKHNAYSKHNKYYLLLFILLGIILFLFTWWWSVHFKINIQVKDNTFTSYTEVLPDCDSVKVELLYKDANGALLDNNSFCTPRANNFDLNTFIKDFNGYDFINITQIDEYTWVYNYNYNYIKQLQQTQDKMGNYGRLYMPSIGISVAINYAPNNCDNLSLQQSYVNNVDSACMSNYGCEYFIADHFNQGFSNITKLSPGDLIYIKRNSGVIETWKCVYGGNGTNGVYDALTFNGVSIGAQNSGGICLYTCHGNDSYNVYMRFFQKV